MHGRFACDVRSLEVKGVLNEYYAQVRKQDYFKKSIELLRGTWPLRSSTSLPSHSHIETHAPPSVMCSQSVH